LVEPMNRERPASSPGTAASDGTVVVLGLGYVGLPLAVKLAESFDTVGFDVDAKRLSELETFHDRTGEVDRYKLQHSRLRLSSAEGDLPPSEFIIVTVPTPIDDDNRPDLSIVESASRTAAGILRRSVGHGRPPVVIYESTVYPGVTEEICGPILARESGLRYGVDFFVGYSPERINPGDREHTIDRIAKVVSGQNSEVLDRVAALYETVTSGGVFRAASIKAAEAAKVIENAQRDINIAFINEITQIFSALDLSIWDVLAAAHTKWNFLRFEPGLVGGHCIGVDPYYLSERAEQLGMQAEVVLAGRSINNGMANWLAGKLHELRGNKPGTALILGLTFKENVPDLRNSKVVDLIAALKKAGHDVTVHDPLASSSEAEEECGIMIEETALDRVYDLVVLAVPHKAYVEMGETRLRELVARGGTLADPKNVLSGNADWTL